MRLSNVGGRIRCDFTLLSTTTVLPDMTFTLWPFLPSLVDWKVALVFTVSESLKWIQQFRTIVTLRLFMQQDNVLRLNLFVEGWLKYIIYNHTWLHSTSGSEGSLAELAPCSKIGGKVRLPRYLSLVTNSCIAAARNPRLSPNCSPHYDGLCCTLSVHRILLFVPRCYYHLSTPADSDNNNKNQQ